jgi:hypothetical protein
MTETPRPQFVPAGDEAGPTAQGSSLRALATDVEPDGPVLAGHRIRVTLEDGRAFVVRVDNRDFVRWDKTANNGRNKWGSAQDVPFRFQTFLAWSAALRAGEFDAGFPDFEDACVEARDVEDGGDDAARPTR